MELGFKIKSSNDNFWSQIIVLTWSREVLAVQTSCSMQQVAASEGLVHIMTSVDKKLIAHNGTAACPGFLQLSLF